MMIIASHRWSAWCSRRPLVLLLVASLLLFAGCGSDESDGVTTTTEATSSTVDVTTTSAATTTSATEPAGEVVEVYFGTGDGSDCSEVAVFPRPVHEGADLVRAAFDELVAGPTAEEEAAGASSFFSTGTAGTVTSAAVADGLLVVDFTDLRALIPNASTSCGSEALLAQLNATGFQFPDVQRARYRIDGSCDDFANWLQRECFDTDRDGNPLDVPTNERASGSGCTPPSADSLRDGRWFGFIDEAVTAELSFDLACWFTGTAAAAAATEDGEESPPPNDYYVRNEADRLRTLGVDPAADVNWLPNPGDPASAQVIGYVEWLEEQPGRDYVPGVWVDVKDGLVIAIEEQYVP